MTTKTKGRTDQVAMAEWEREDPWLGKGKWTAVLGHQAGLGVKTVYMAGAAEHEQHDHPLGARSHPGWTWGEYVTAVDRHGLLGQQSGKCQGAKSGSQA